MNYALAALFFSIAFMIYFGITGNSDAATHVGIVANIWAAAWLDSRKG